jgi:glycosyltransferase involved in cell wall biosynthesis
MNRVLVLSSRFPWPPFTGDRLRGTIWLDALARQSEVALVAPDGTVPPAAPPFRFFPAARSFAGAARGALRVMLEGLPLQALLAAPYAWQNAIERAEAEAGPFDVTIVLLSRLDPWIRSSLNGERRVLDAIDSLRQNAHQRACEARPFVRWFWRGEERRLARAEGDAARAYDHVVMVSDEDLAELGGSGSAISNGVVIAALEDKPRRFDFGFWGRLAYFANADAASYLLDEIWPLIRQRRAAATLTIAGADVPPAVRRRAAREGVTLLSPVEHMPALARDVRVALLPLRYGSGESTKTMEAAEAGCAIVGTPKAFRGVPALAAHARVASTPAALADAAVELLDDEVTRRRMAAELRAAVAASYARETTLARLAAVAAVKECA